MDSLAKARGTDVNSLCFFEKTAKTHFSCAAQKVRSGESDSLNRLLVENDREKIGRHRTSNRQGSSFVKRKRCANCCGKLQFGRLLEDGNDIESNRNVENAVVRRNTR
jgi:hypothetical protein